MEKNRKLTKIGERPKSASQSEKEPLYNGKLQVGMRVSHDRFGEGKVIDIEANAPNNTKATIEFANYGKKQLLLKFAKLKIIS
jgi:DNA helicase-2/ATP-dependent DNA helicase PcrA